MDLNHWTAERFIPSEANLSNMMLWTKVPKALPRSKNVGQLIVLCQCFQAECLSRVWGMWMFSEVDESQIGEEKETYAPVNSCIYTIRWTARSSILEKTGSAEIGREFRSSFVNRRDNSMFPISVTSLIVLFISKVRGSRQSFSSIL